MRRILNLLAVLLLVSLVGCESRPIADFLLPLSFKSIDEIRAEKEIRNAPSYNGSDPQNLISVDACYQFSDLPDDIKFSRYKIKSSYITANYIYYFDNKEFLSKFSDLGMSNDELASISLTAHRNSGQKEYDEYLSGNLEAGKMITLGNISNIHYEEALYKEEVMSKVYYFVYMDQLFSMSVPGNVYDEVVSNLIENIDKIYISKK